MQTCYNVTTRKVAIMEKDVKKLKACLNYKDYYSMLLYCNLIINNYYGSNKEILLHLISNIKKGNYETLEEILKNFNSSY